MAQPTASDVHVDAVLTNLSVAYIQEQDAYIATKVFPVIPVDKKSDKYYVYTKNDWFRDEAQRRVGATESAGSGFNLSTDTYSCDKWAFHKDVDDDTRQNADAPLNPDRDATEFVTQRLLLRQEREWASSYFTTGVWGTDKTGGTDFTKWDDATSDPKENIKEGKSVVLKATGRIPNTLVLGYDVYDALSDHPDFVDRIKYTTAGNITPQLLAQLLDVERVLVARAIYATNVEGETAAYDFVHGKHALLCYVAPRPGLLVPSAGYIFAWKGVSGGLGTQIAIKRFRMEQLAADRIEGEIAFDDKVVAADLGYFLASCVS